MIRSMTKTPLNLAAALYRSYFPSTSTASFRFSTLRFFSLDSTKTNDSQATQLAELPRVPSLLEGCDYQHWLVVMEAPKGYPLRDEIVSGYVSTLTMALGSEEEAKKSIYSVSTKYYYAFGCKVPEIFTYRIKSLPNVKWVLPDSYLCGGEDNYGGEPFVNGQVVPYDEKYHMDWVRHRDDENPKNTTLVKKSRRKRKNKNNKN